jgi:tripartite-type tricarboxylate transporter receptor subunit TctC|tara:strand:- start:50 stop:223 length:174 start_codon:yes stop_codon:yes gene_type:complete
MAKKNGTSVVNLGAGGLKDLTKRIIGAKIGSALSGGSITGSAMGTKLILGKNGKKGK